MAQYTLHRFRTDHFRPSTHISGALKVPNGLMKTVDVVNGITIRSVKRFIRRQTMNQRSTMHFIKTIKTI